MMEISSLLWKLLVVLHVFVAMTLPKTIMAFAEEECGAHHTNMADDQINSGLSL